MKTSTVDTRCRAENAMPPGGGTAIADLLWAVRATNAGPIVRRPRSSRRSFKGGFDMSSTLVRRLVLLAVMLALPGVTWAQEATIAGTITDTTGGVLPGVTVARRATTPPATRFEAVTDERGAFRIPVRIGGYTVTAELSGFGTVNRDAELLVGQTVDS